MIRSIALAAVALLIGQAAFATTFLLDIRGSVVSRDVIFPADWATLMVGAPIHAQFILDTQSGTLTGDGVTHIELGGKGIRARLFVAGTPLDVEPHVDNGGQAVESDSSNPTGEAGAPPGLDVFAVAHVSFDDTSFFSDPSRPPAAIRFIDPVFSAAGPSTLVAMPVVALGRGMTLSAATGKTIFLFDGFAFHPSAGSTNWSFGSGSWASLSVDTFSLVRCERPLNWVATGAAWPKGEVECN